MSLNKRKFCNGCLSDQFIWKNHDGKKYCLNCWNRIKPPIPFKTKVIKVNTKPKKSIAPISKNRYEALKRYRRLREKYFIEHPVCEFPGCHSKKVTLHHKKGRIGNLLTDKRYFCSLCLKHHNYVEEHPDEAIKLGLSIKRLDI